MNVRWCSTAFFVLCLSLFAVAMKFAHTDAFDVEKPAKGAKQATVHSSSSLERPTDELLLGKKNSDVPNTFLGSDSDPFRVLSFVPASPIFAAPTAPPQSRVLVQEAPPPVEFPYRFFGRMIGSTGKESVYLTNGTAMVAITPGLILDNAYRIDTVTDTLIVVTYLPLNQRIELPVTSAK